MRRHPQPWLLGAAVLTASALLASPLLAQPRIRINNASLQEDSAGPHQVDLAIRLTASVKGVVTVDYATSTLGADQAAQGASCGSDVDFEQVSGTVQFDPGVVDRTIPVVVCGDVADEGDEKFQVNLSNPVGAPLAESFARFTILDDDDGTPPPPPPLPTLSIDDIVFPEGAADLPRFVTVRLSAPASDTVRVLIEALPDGTASEGSCVAGRDFIFDPRTVTLNPGRRDLAVRFTLCGDEEVEFNEAFTLVLRDPVNATLGDAQGQVLIRNDDEALPTISVDVADSTTFVERDADVPRSVFVRLSSETTQPVSVLIRPRTEGTAIQGPCDRPESDYRFARRTVTIPAGEIELEVPFTLCGDIVADGDENFVLELVNPDNATIGRAVAEFTIQDNEAGGIPNLTVNIDRSPEFLTQDASRLVYFVEVVNTGDGPAPNVVVQSTLPNGVAFVGVENSQMGPCPQSSTDPSGALQVNCTLSSLVAGGSRNVRIVGKVTAAIQDGTRLAFGAKVDPSNIVAEQNEADNVAVLGTTVRAQSDLQIAKVESDTLRIQRGAPFVAINDFYFEFQWTVKNDGPHWSPPTTLRIEWPAGAVHVFGEDGNHIPRPDEASVPALEPSASFLVARTVLLRTFTNDPTMAQVRVTVDPDGTNLDGNAGNNSSTLSLLLR